MADTASSRESDWCPPAQAPESRLAGSASALSSSPEGPPYLDFVLPDQDDRI